MSIVFTQYKLRAGSTPYRLVALEIIVLVLLLVLSFVESRAQSLAYECPSLPTQGPDHQVSLSLAPLGDSLGFVCLRVLNRLPTGVLVFPFFRLEAWEHDTADPAGHFRDLLGLSSLKFTVADGKAVPSGGRFDSQQPLGSRYLLAGRYRFCFRYARLGQKEYEDVCSPVFTMPIPLAGCPLLPTQGLPQTVTLSVAEARDRSGFLCARGINGLGELIRVTGGGWKHGFDLEKWEDGAWWRNGRFRPYPLPERSMPVAALGNGALLAGGIMDDRMPLYASLPAGRYRVCLRYVRHGQQEHESVCSEALTLP